MIQISQSNRAIDPQKLSQMEMAFDQLMSRSDVGFFQLPYRNENWEAAQNRWQQIQSVTNTVVFVGIGGSGLGGKTISQALQYEFESENLVFLENLDQWTLSKQLRKISHLEKTHWVFISKSGSTLETLAIANNINDFLQSQGMSLTGASTVISEAKESPLTNWANANEIPILAIDLDVGGRFSVLSPVGLFPAAAMGVDIIEIQKGARWALEQKKLVAELAAHAVESFGRSEWVTQFWFYCDGLKCFGEWIQQLWAESLAKKANLQGETAPRVSTPMGCVGAIDQHSILQQVMEGPRDKMIWLTRVTALEKADRVHTNMFVDFPYLESKSVADVLNAEATGIYSAMQEEDISVLQINWKDLSPETLGAGFMLFELVVATIGEHLTINTYNQPGVELGKKLAKQLLLAN